MKCPGEGGFIYNYCCDGPPLLDSLFNKFFDYADGGRFSSFKGGDLFPNIVDLLLPRVNGEVFGLEVLLLMFSL